MGGFGGHHKTKMPSYLYRILIIKITKSYLYNDLSLYLKICSSYGNGTQVDSEKWCEHDTNIPDSKDPRIDID